MVKRKHVERKTIGLVIGLVVALFFVVLIGVLWIGKRGEVDQLTSEFNSLNTEFNSLESRFNALQGNYSNLQSQYSGLQSQYSSLQTSYSTLQSNNSSLQSEVNDLQQKINLYGQVPHGYYQTDVFENRPDTLSELQNFLSSGEVKRPRNFQENVFDCSNMSAYVEWALEDAGFDAHIVTGPYPPNPNTGYHAWVIVYTTDSSPVPIESTAIEQDSFLGIIYYTNTGIVYSSDSNYDRYLDGYDHDFKNIYAAVLYERGISEWDWWTGYYSFT